MTVAVGCSDFTFFLTYRFVAEIAAHLALAWGFAETRSSRHLLMVTYP